jgi:hypothetical protein
MIAASPEKPVYCHFIFLTLLVSEKQAAKSGGSGFPGPLVLLAAYVRPDFSISA